MPNDWNAKTFTHSYRRYPSITLGEYVEVESMQSKNLVSDVLSGHTARQGEAPTAGVQSTPCPLPLLWSRSAIFIFQER